MRTTTESWSVRVAGQADLIVSDDQHLRRLKAFQGIGIVHPTDFRRTLGELDT